MNKENIYLSLPSVIFGEKKTTNEDILAIVRDNFRGDPGELKRIMMGIKYVFNYCGTDIRYMGIAPGKKTVDYAVDASLNLLKTNNLPVEKLDLVIYGGIYREYLEPAVAMEVSKKLGLKSVYAFDVGDACAGLMQSVIVARSLMMADDTINYALCCTTDFPDVVIDYDIQTFEELATKAAGLTLGSAASAWLLSREPLQQGGCRIVETQNTSLPESFDLCMVIISEKKFTSLSKEIFDLGIEHVPGEIRKIVKKANWDLQDIDFFISHQPGKKIMESVCEELKVDKNKTPVVHNLYGNTVNSTVPMTLDHLIKKNALKSGDKIVMNSAAAGFTMVSIAGEWI